MDRQGIYIWFAFGLAMIYSEAEEVCECTAYFRCPNDKIVTDGKGILDIRINTCSGIDVCCLIPTTTPDQPKSVNAQTVYPEPLYPCLTDPSSDDPTGINCSTKYTLPTILGTPGCGRRRFGWLPSRISNAGLLAKTFYGEAPWMVMIINVGTFFCGGTLIKPSFVLTAAHCIPDFWFSRLTVRVGEYDIGTTDEPIKHADKKVKRVVSHQDYDRKYLSNDVALIELDTPAVLTETVDITCLPDGAEPVKTEECVAYGWGFTDKIQGILKKVDQSIISKDECENRMRHTPLGKNFSLHPGFFCAVGEITKEIWKGDGGGPLICPQQKDDTRLVQVGIISWGIDCGNRKPTVFASVDHYMPWIKQQIG
ncbi:trypsin-like [Cimex lectularius]|uniref:Peptidase S1 domain-containing protein n=1 Tax=Cimex lectularius TaxID=79782 RepID=A0A8I6RYB6_CIMLE|nr:trypsin-like [Cimex lectularius]